MLHIIPFQWGDRKDMDRRFKKHMNDMVCCLFYLCFGLLIDQDCFYLRFKNKNNNNKNKNNNK